MRKYENDCVGCPPEMGCLGSSCSNRNALHIYCDKCHIEVDFDGLYEYDGDELCEDCLKDACRVKITDY